MKIKEFLSLEHTQIITAKSKKKVFEIISRVLTGEGDLKNKEIKFEEVFEALLAREKLGSTAVGFGIALPHARLDSLLHTQIILLKTTEGVDFHAPDSKPVDLFFAILLPNHKKNQHLYMLNYLSGIFEDHKKREDLRSCSTKEELYKVAQELFGNYELPENT